MNERRLALDTLQKVVNEGAYSDILIRDVMNDSHINDNEKGFYKALVLGTLSKIIELDYIINYMSKLKPNKISAHIRNILRLSLYQLIYMIHIPHHAVLDEANRLARRFGNDGSRAFVNGMLRSYLRGGFDGNKVVHDDYFSELAYKYSVNRDLIKYLAEDNSVDIIALLESYNKAPTLYLRVRSIDTDEAISVLCKEGYEAERALYNVDFIKVGNSKGIFDTELFKEGKLAVQDNSSGIIANAFKFSPSSNVLDLCAAPGGKSLHFADKLNGGFVLSCDLIESRLNKIKENAHRLHTDNIKFKVNDAMKLHKEFVDKFDVVLADVPCSGFGVIRRKPEIRLRTPEIVTQLSKQSRKILDIASRYVKKDGILIFSTCTIARDENEVVALDFLSKHTDFILESPKSEYLNLCDNNGFIRIYPYMDMDGFFISAFRRK